MKTQEIKRREAAERQAEYDKLSLNQKIDRVVERKLAGKGDSKREHARLAKQVEATRK